MKGRLTRIITLLEEIKELLGDMIKLKEEEARRTRIRDGH